MRRVKWIKKVMVFVLTMAMCCGTSLNVLAADAEHALPDGWKSLDLPDEQIELLNGSIMPREPAPALSSVTITDLTVDENNEIHIEVQGMGTAKSVLCWCNGMQCTENYNAMQDIISGNRVIGTYRYFHTKIYYTESASGTTINARVQAINAMSPWNTLTTSRTFIVP